ncbi:hypothetical protein ACFL6C_10455 [Myxococcota bacterium]
MNHEIHEVGIVPAAVAYVHSSVARVVNIRVGYLEILICLGRCVGGVLQLESSSSNRGPPAFVDLDVPHGYMI